MVSYSIETLSCKITAIDIIDFENAVTLKTGLIIIIQRRLVRRRNMAWLGSVEDTEKCHHSIEGIRLPIIDVL